jgi:hypothetical protein
MGPVLSRDLKGFEILATPRNCRFVGHMPIACGAIFRRLLASSPQIVRVYSRRIIKCTDSLSSQLMATQIVAWQALSPSSPRAARAGRDPAGFGA